MSLIRYETYRAANVLEGLPIPTHWVEKRIRDVARVINGYPFDSALFDPENGLPLVRIRDLGQERTDTRFSGETVPSALIDANDVLIGMDGDFEVGRWRGTGSALLNQRLCCVRADSPVVTRFIEYCLPQPLQAINDVTYATTVKHLSSGQVERIRIAVPPQHDELASIVRFLDHETAKIDALIAKQERLMALLQEKRQAVISHAVTKGLDPSVPMKKSGVEWIGEVPAHWQTRRLKDVVSRFVSGGTPDTDQEAYWTIEQEGIPWVTIGDMSSGAVVVRTEKYITEAARKDRRLQFVEAGMLLISMYASLGKVTPIGTKAVINQALLGIAPDVDSIDGGFLLWWLRHIEPLHAQTASSNTQANLNAQKVRNIPVPLPPLDEQRAIADFIEESHDRLRGAAEASAQAVQLLRERRSALIAAAVTGQIDVRGLVDTAA